MANTATSTTLTGYFAGTVAISEPIALGALDLALDLTEDGGQIAGTLDGERSQAFDASPALQGSITGATGGITPTFRLVTNPFSSVISGRTVTRSLVLTGEIVDNGAKLQGSYEEMIAGYTPKPVQVRGTFLLVRSFRTQPPNAPKP